MNSIAFGIPEFLISLIISMPIWLKMKRELYIPSIIFFVFLGIALIVTIWQVFNREKALAYLIALKSRMLYLSSVFLISQIGDFFENDK